LSAISVGMSASMSISLAIGVGMLIFASILSAIAVDVLIFASTRSATTGGNKRPTRYEDPGQKLHWQMGCGRWPAARGAPL